MANLTGKGGYKKNDKRPRGKSPGRKRIPPDVKKLIEAATPRAVRTVVWLMDHSKKDVVRLRAAEIIIERNLGKVPQPITGKDGQPVIFELVQYSPSGTWSKK